MTNKHDYKAALEWVETAADFLPSHMKQHYKATQSALRLADRLQSGDEGISMSMTNIGEAITYKAFSKGYAASEDEVFKAMTTRMMKEIEDD